MIRKIFPILISFLLLGTPAWAKLNVVATLPWIGSLAGDLGQDRVKVATLVKPNQDPHYVEAKPSMILEVRKADLLALQRSGFGSRLSSRAGGILPESENSAGKSRLFGLFPIHRGPGHGRKGPTGAWGTSIPRGIPIITSLQRTSCGWQRELPPGFPPSTRPGKLSTSTNLLLSETGWPQNKRNGKECPWRGKNSFPIINFLNISPRSSASSSSAISNPSPESLLRQLIWKS